MFIFQEKKESVFSDKGLFGLKNINMELVILFNFIQIIDKFIIYYLQNS